MHTHWLGDSGLLTGPGNDKCRSILANVSWGSVLVRVTPAVVKHQDLKLQGFSWFMIPYCSSWKKVRIEIQAG